MAPELRERAGAAHPITMRFPVPLSTLRSVRSTEARRPAELPSPLYAARQVDLRVTGGAAPETSERYPALLLKPALIDPRIASGVIWSMDYRDRITIEPGKRSGKPCIRGLRITVSDVLEYLASGMTEDEILSEFPDLEREDIRASLAFAADRERKLMAAPPV